MERIEYTHTLSVFREGKDCFWKPFGSSVANKNNNEKKKQSITTNKKNSANPSGNGQLQWQNSAILYSAGPIFGT